MTDIMVVKNTLKDYGVWREIFDSNVALQLEHGLHVRNIYQSKEDPNTVFGIIEVEDIARAQEFTKKITESGLAEKAGVIDSERTLCTDMT